MSMRSAASCCQDLQESAVPRGARTTRARLGGRAHISHRWLVGRVVARRGRRRDRCPCRRGSTCSFCRTSAAASRAPAPPEALDRADGEEHDRRAGRRTSGQRAGDRRRRPRRRAGPPRRRGPGTGEPRRAPEPAEGVHDASFTPAYRRPRRPRRRARPSRTSSASASISGAEHAVAVVGRRRARARARAPPRGRARSRAASRNSSAWQAASSSMARMRRVFATTRAALRAAVGAHRDVVFLVGGGRDRVDAGGVGERLVLGGEGRGGDLRDHQAGLQAAVAGQERGQAGERRVHEPLDAPLADRAELRHRDRQHVGRDGHRLAVEVAAREQLARLGEHHRVVGGRVHLDARRCAPRRRARRARRRAPAGMQRRL